MTVSVIGMLPIGELTPEENHAYQLCLGQLSLKQPRAELRSNFYNTKKMLDKVGFSIPPSMANLDAVLGWPTKAVDGLSGRLKMGGFVVPGKKGIHPDLDLIFSQNRMAIEWPQVQTGAFVHGVAFVAVTPGDTAAGEPEVLISNMPATEATGLWNVRTRRLDAALWIPNYRPDQMQMLHTTAVLFLKDHTTEMTRDTIGGPWTVKRIPNALPRVPVTAVVHRPQLGRAFGMSRLSRSVIYLCQMAARTLLRTEVSAEFYSSPQRYAMGATAEDFVDEHGDSISAWDTIMGKTWLIGRDDQGEIPTVGQFPQATMQPHLDMMRMITTLFAGETCLPVSSLGVVHENPHSAAAIDAAWADMVELAELCQTEIGVPAIEIAQNVLMTKNKLGSIPDELVRLRVKWQNAATPTLAAQTDAVVKQIAAGALQPDSEVGLEQMGYDDTDIERIRNEHEVARAAASADVNSLVNGVVNAPRNLAAPNAQPAVAGKPQPGVGNGVAPARPAGPPRN